MSVEAAERLLNRFAAEIDAACAQGRGKELHDRFIQEMATEFASGVYLAMDAKVAAATEETIGAVWEWVQEYPHQRGLGFVESVSQALKAYGASDEQRADAEHLAAKSYQERLNYLLDHAEIGGVA